MMKDFLETDLEIGNYVIISLTEFSNLTVAQVVKFTPQKVRVKYKDMYGRIKEKLMDPDRMVKVNSPDMTAYVLRNPLN